MDLIIKLTSKLSNMGLKWVRQKKKKTQKNSNSKTGIFRHDLFLVICPGMLSCMIRGVITVSGKRMSEFKSFQNKCPKR